MSPCSYPCRVKCPYQYMFFLDFNFFFWSEIILIIKYCKIVKMGSGRVLLKVCVQGNKNKFFLMSDYQRKQRNKFFLTYSLLLHHSYRRCWLSIDLCRSPLFAAGCLSPWFVSCKFAASIAQTSHNVALLPLYRTNFSILFF